MKERSCGTPLGGPTGQWHFGFGHAPEQYILYDSISKKTIAASLLKLPKVSVGLPVKRRVKTWKRKEAMVLLTRILSRQGSSKDRFRKVAPWFSLHQDASGMLFKKRGRTFFRKKNSQEKFNKKKEGKATPSQKKFSFFTKVTECFSGHFDLTSTLAGTLKCPHKSWKPGCRVWKVVA